jgi:tetratricopeptide (TPR) repeat protein
METNYEEVKSLFSKLKKSQPAETDKCIEAIIEKSLFLERAQRSELAEAFNVWALQQGAHPILYAYSKLLVGFTFFYHEQYDKALPLLVEAQNLLTEQNELNGAAVCMDMQGSIFRTFGSVDLALKANMAGREQLRKSGRFSFFRIASETNIGGIYYDRNHYDGAIPHFKDALEMAEKRNTPYWIIYALHGLGKSYLMQNKFPESKASLEKAIAAAEKLKHPQQIANSLTELGNYYFTTGDYAEAEKLHKQSLEIREKNQYAGGAVTNCIRLGEIYIKQSKPSEAIAFLEKGLKLAEKIKVKPKMYQVHKLLSEIYESMDELAKSLFHFRQYHELREQVELEDNDRKIKNAHLVFEAESALKENVTIKKQKAEIEKKNIQLQETIDELTRARIGKKARAITMGIAIVLFIIEDSILHFALTVVSTDNYFISLIVKMVIIFSLAPINKIVENNLLKKVIRKKKAEIVAAIEPK